MAEQKPTMLTTSSKRTYMFDKNGVWEMSSSLFDFEEDLNVPDMPPDRADRIWSLVDSPWSQEKPLDSSIWLTESLSYMFPVQTVSPNESGYKEWKHSNIRFSNRIYIMDPWNVEDMLAVLKLSNHQPPIFPDKQYMCQVMQNTGPIPTDVFHHFVDAEGGRIFRGSFTRFDNTDSLTKNVLSYFSFGDSRSCDQAFVMRRFEHEGKSDRVLLDFKSTWMEESIRAQFQLLRLEEAERLFSVCPFPERSSLAGWFFEGVAVHRLSGYGKPHSRCRLAELRRMRRLDCLTPDPETDVRGPSFIEDDASISRLDGCILHVDSNGSDLLEKCNVSALEEPQTIPCFSIPCRKETMLRSVSKVSDISSPCSHYDFHFIATRNNPLVDAFSYDKLDVQNKPVLWVYKIVDAKFGGPGEETAAYNVIRDLKAYLEHFNGRHVVEIRYVLVAPKRDKTPVIVWRMPANGWADDVQGDVYVQYIDPIPWRSTPT
ncbi:hypothetical protein CPB84DRAFT_1764249 [Gymnopilus junonius]|uniref:Uncharacterized protein n=1 Tax=Gymnopilus junonius TaxID=109634 RepID=A0A9P5NW73_GYMJU|nr:hypothetical protein CPB84DRAFT_1764249 [Gymnopilus junonius]